MTDEVVEVEKMRELRDFDGRVVALWRDEDRVLFIYDDTIKIDLSSISSVKGVYEAEWLIK